MKKVLSIPNIDEIDLTYFMIRRSLTHMMTTLMLPLTHWSREWRNWLGVFPVSYTVDRGMSWLHDNVGLDIQEIVMLGSGVCPGSRALHAQRPALPMMHVDPVYAADSYSRLARQNLEGIGREVKSENADVEWGVKLSSSTAKAFLATAEAKSLVRPLVVLEHPPAVVGPDRQSGALDSERLLQTWEMMCSAAHLARSKDGQVAVANYSSDEKRVISIMAASLGLDVVNEVSFPPDPWVQTKDSVQHVHESSIVLDYEIVAHVSEQLGRVENPVLTDLVASQSYRHMMVFKPKSGDVSPQSPDLTAMISGCMASQFCEMQSGQSLLALVGGLGDLPVQFDSTLRDVLGQHVT